MMNPQQVKIWTTRLLLGYIVIGSNYYLSWFLVMFFTGKDIVHSPLVGYPLTLMGWPWMMYADLVHHRTLGLRIPTIITLFSLIAFGCYLFIKYKNFKKSKAFEDGLFHTK